MPLSAQDRATVEATAGGITDDATLQRVRRIHHDKIAVARRKITHARDIIGQQERVVAMRRYALELLGDGGT